jgi:hypothetical protein
VEQLGAGSGAEGIQALLESALEFIETHVYWGLSGNCVLSPLAADESWR